MVENVWVIIPTYNEAGNIAALVEKTRDVLQANAIGYHLLIVDDNSPDGTGKLADQLAERYDDVEVLHRTDKAGLGKAYIAGFKRALAGGAEYIVEMDADFSHSPESLPFLVKGAASGVDLMLGSRYVSSGGVSNWGILRRLISRSGCLYAQAILAVRVRDLTGGFKCFRAGTLRQFDLDNVRAEGYGFQIELTYRALQAGLAVKEYPIIFSEREVGESKMSLSIALEAALVVPALRFGSHQKTHSAA